MFLGLKSFRSGIRKNNSKFMLAGRQAVAPLMFIGKHRIYQHIIVRDLQIRYQFLCFYNSCVVCPGVHIVKYLFIRQCYKHRRQFSIHTMIYILIEVLICNCHKVDKIRMQLLSIQRHNRFL